MLGWIQTVLHSAILQIPEDKCPASEKIEAVAAINKVRLAYRSRGTVLLVYLTTCRWQVLWIQNDLFSRHYIGD